MLYQQEIDKYICDRRPGEFPHVVAARFHRKYIDANRSLTDGAVMDYCNDTTRNTYKEYHDRIHECIEHASARHGFALLVDIHGTKQ
jgi:N-formylglutamate amidohydrolase